MTLRVLATVPQPSPAMRVDVATGTGFAVTLDAPPQGLAAGPWPRELVLAALAACAAMDVSAILGKKRQPPAAYQIAVEAEAQKTHPQVFTLVRIEHRVTGDVEPEALRRAVELSATRYCPVNAMLSQAVRIEHRYRLSRAGQPDREALVVVTGQDDFGG